MQFAYLIRYGLMRQVGRFHSDIDELERGRSVVIRSRRGTELGEVLLQVPPEPKALPSVEPALVIRAAVAADVERARRNDVERDQRFAACERIFHDGIWPIELIDVEPLLDERRTVLHYLGPHALDVAGLRSVFRERCGLDILLEPVGRDTPDLPEASSEEAEEEHSCGSCGSESGGCGSGGCSTSGESSGGGCSDCGVKKLLSSRRVTAAR